MPPTAHICTNAAGCVVEGQSAEIATDEHGMVDYNPPTERSGAYNRSSEQSSNDAIPITITSRRIVFNFINEELYVGDDALAFTCHVAKAGASLDADRRANAADAAVANSAKTHASVTATVVRLPSSSVSWGWKRCSRSGSPAAADRIGLPPAAEYISTCFNFQSSREYDGARVFWPTP